MPSLVRTNSGSSKASRRRARWLLTADWVSQSAEAAIVTLRVSRMASKTRNRFRSIRFGFIGYFPLSLVLRGNGAVVVDRSLEEAVVFAWYVEYAARVELDVLAKGLVGRVFDPAEAASRAVTSGRLFERMWDWLVAGDPSAAAMPPPSPA